MMNAPDFEAEHTEETATGREELDTEAAARDLRRWLEDTLNADRVKLKDNRPQHEGQRDGAVTFTVTLAEEATYADLVDAYEAADAVDAEGVTGRIISVGDREGQYSVIISKWSASFPVYSDYFGHSIPSGQSGYGTAGRNQSHPLG